MLAHIKRAASWCVPYSNAIEDARPRLGFAMTFLIFISLATFAAAMFTVALQLREEGRKADATATEVINEEYLPTRLPAPAKISKNSEFKAILPASAKLSGSEAVISTPSIPKRSGDKFKVTVSKNGDPNIIEENQPTQATLDEKRDVKDKLPPIVNNDAPKPLNQPAENSGGDSSANTAERDKPKAVINRSFSDLRNKSGFVKKGVAERNAANPKDKKSGLMKEGTWMESYERQAKVPLEQGPDAILNSPDKKYSNLAGLMVQLSNMMPEDFSTTKCYLQRGQQMLKYEISPNGMGACSWAVPLNDYYRVVVVSPGYKTNYVDFWIGDNNDQIRIVNMSLPSKRQ
jgi:hypothetical protein